MKLRTAFLLMLLLLAQAVQPAAWASSAVSWERSESILQNASCPQAAEVEGCCENACACCKAPTPEPVAVCSCEAVPEDSPPVPPFAPAPAPGVREGPPLLTEWASPAPPEREPVLTVLKKGVADFEKAAPRAAGKIRACVRHCALLI